MSHTKLKNALRRYGFKYRYDKEANEYIVSQYKGRHRHLRGIIGMGGEYPYTHPGQPFVILSDDWCRRANSEYRALWYAEAPYAALEFAQAYFFMYWHLEGRCDWHHEF